MAALNNHLVPSTEASVEHLAPKCRESAAAAAAGTTKRKELHGTTSIHALSGAWVERTNDATFQAYKLDFSCSNEDVNYSRFILLIESKLDEDVGNIEVDLYSLSKLVKSSVSSCGLVHLDPEQIMKAKRFQEFFFNGMFGKLFVGSKEARRCVFQNGTELLWCSPYAYLLLPIDTSEVHDYEPWKINWKAIDSCTAAVEFLKHCLLGLHINKETVTTPLNMCDLADVIEPDGTKLRCANGLFESNSLSEKVVVAVHTGRIYAVLQVAHEMTAETPFEESAGSKKPGFESHADYFYQKYGIVLKYPRQQLLQLKQSHNPHNLLVDFHDLGAKISQGGPITKKPADHAFIPPELLYILDVPITVLSSCYLLPSLLHRLESLMLASQLRGEINYQANNVNIPIYLILEAITTLRCNESFSMERLELLGDSVLKYTTSCHLFLKYPRKNEGQLTRLRSRVICNLNLHQLGTERKIQGYIRDCPFDPRRWVAPGQITRFPEPCGCNVDSSEVPLDPKFQSEDPKVKHGKACDRGHRWLISKTISDCIEALIGAYYIAGGLDGAIHLMKWFGLEAELMPSFVAEAINSASLHSISPKTANEIAALESKIGYQFSNKGLLLEALTHHSCREEGIQYSYERLEFLGDSALDMLITQHLYHAHPNTDPGELTDLRSASVNNESFAQSAVKYNLEVHLQHCSSILPTQLKEYVDSCRGVDDNTRLLEGSKGPKALGDLMESIAGAVLIDTNLNFDEVWRIFKPLLSPIVTPDKLELPPFRELTELCDHLGYFIREKSVPKEDIMHAEISLQLKDELLIGQGQDRSRKEAKGKAALQVLKKLEARGITFARVMRKGKDLDHTNDATDSQSVASISDERTDEHSLPKISKIESHSMKEGKDASHVPAELSPKKPALDLPILVVGPIDMKKGGPRSSLYQLCKQQQWPMPTFDTTEEKESMMMEFDDGMNGFNSFTSKITLHIPNHGSIECMGNPRADKKSSFDSAALSLLHELKKLGRISGDDATLSQSVGSISCKRTEHSSPKRNIQSHAMEEGENEESLPKGRKIENHSIEEGKDAPTVLVEPSPRELHLDHSVPVVGPIDMKKGGPRNALFQLCQQQQWPVPTFEPHEEKASVLMEFDGVKGFNSFMSKVNLNIPNHGVIECRGNPRADKKSSFDSAALCVLHELQKLGRISGYDATKSQSMAGLTEERREEHSSPKRRKIESQTMEEGEDEKSLPKGRKIENHSMEEGKDVAAVLAEPSPKEPHLDLSVPVVGPIDMKKGGPRNALFQLCQQQQWPVPTFEPHEEKASILMEFDDGMKGFNSFVSKVNLHIPNHGAIECRGNPRADKKSSFDSAALCVLHELQKLGRISGYDATKSQSMAGLTEERREEHSSPKRRKIESHTMEEGEDEKSLPKGRKIENHSMEEGKDAPAVLAEPSSKEPHQDLSLPVVGPIDMKKGGPRNALFQLCQQQQWPVPTFEPHEEKASVLMEFDDGVKGFNSFVSKVNLHIPDHGAIQCRGNPRADKRSSFDSAALCALHELQKLGRISGYDATNSPSMAGISVDRTDEHSSPKRRKIENHEMEEGEDENSSPKRRKIENQGMEVGKDATSVPAEPSPKGPDLDLSVPVVGPIDMKKGGPRNALFQLCQQQQWPTPAFDTDEEKARVAIEFDDGVKGFSSFTSKIKLHIPNHGDIECRGYPRADKRGSMDSAALSILHELQKQGRIIIRMQSS
ncbi:hypothetical protein SAY86_001828 [Trapa natans]|uniref:Uncharacterized protein n=1 Tax=Trapa natans TaxID=22666 RepID=A0AAN7LI61_TRANT|nr:hypothetical protein SAY86_001828 [Trapa natans]